MNSQELRNLQEAYMEVYELDEELTRLDKKDLRNKKFIKNSPYFEIDQFTTDKRRVAAHDARRGVKAKKRANESFDLYDIILSHLLDEGYAETQEQAEVIMVNMSEDWRESIVEARVDVDLSGQQKRKLEI